ncbi:MAG TPA: vitamin K epoxide reductase family protein [Candidatus Sulfotelmatobacter sp.]
MQTVAMTGPAPFGRMRRLTLCIATLAVLGIVVSSVSLYHHFGTGKTSFCDLGQAFNCDLVNRSMYSKVAGVPVALIGILGYLAILAFATVYREKAETPFILAIACGGGLAFSLYLTYVEAHILGVWCVLCLTSLALICVLTVLSVSLAVIAFRRG